MLIQAFRRKSDSTHEVNGKAYKFTKNNEGHFVCDVTDDGAVKRFLAIRDAFKPYGDEAAAMAAASTPDGESSGRFVLTNGDARIDLAAMTDDEVKEFIKANDLDVDLRSRGDKLREAVKAELTGA